MKFYQIISFISYHFLHREVHKVSPYKYNKYLGESRQGVRGKIHGNTGSIKPSIEHTGNLLFWYKKKIMISPFITNSVHCIWVLLISYELFY